jgi:hypothetical protein
MNDSHLVSGVADSGSLAADPPAGRLCRVGQSLSPPIPNSQLNTARLTHCRIHVPPTLVILRFVTRPVDRPVRSTTFEKNSAARGGISELATLMAPRSILRMLWRMVINELTHRMVQGDISIPVMIQIRPLGMS